VQIHGVDVFHPQSGEVRSSGPEGIACWFIDTDYNEESFFVRHAYFLGANDPYKALKTTLKAEIDEEAWESLHSDVSRPFGKPGSGRIAVKVINHLGDEVMKVFSSDFSRSNAAKAATTSGYYKQFVVATLVALMPLKRLLRAGYYERATTGSRTVHNEYED
jgi:hypothetical protein